MKVIGFNFKFKIYIYIYIGLMIKLMVLANSFIQMAQNMKANG